jgi:hypothetical protein
MRISHFAHWSKKQQSYSQRAVLGVCDHAQAVKANIQAILE